MSESLHPRDFAFDAEIERFFGTQVREVDDYHRLISPFLKVQMREFISDRHDGARVIVFPEASPDTATHHELVEKRLDAFDSFSIPGLTVLLVPRGAQTMTSLLPAFAQSNQRLHVASEVGSMLRRVQQSGVGLPYIGTGRGVLDQVAFATDDSSEQGARLYLVPPYDLDQQATQADILREVEVELLTSGVFAAPEVQTTLDAITESWNEGRAA